jgi:hypothetical protein
MVAGEAAVSVTVRGYFNADPGVVVWKYGWIAMWGIRIDDQKNLRLPLLLECSI